jgi:hypothetical protein
MAIVLGGPRIRRRGMARWRYGAAALAWFLLACGGTGGGSVDHGATGGGTGTHGPGGDAGQPPVEPGTDGGLPPDAGSIDGGTNDAGIDAGMGF